jgi:hypothetical protein
MVPLNSGLEVKFLDSARGVTSHMHQSLWNFNHETSAPCGAGKPVKEALGGAGRFCRPSKERPRPRSEFASVGEVRRLRKWPPMIILKTSPSLAHAPIVNGILQALTPISIVFGAILFFVALERSGACRTGWIFQHIIKGEPGRCITWNHSEPLGSGCATAG